MNKLICVILCVVLLGAPLAVSAAQTDQVTISNAQELLAFAESCRLDSYSRGLTVSLEADIDLSGVEFAGIPIFCGTFYGNGHSISGVNITAYGSNQGFFRYLTQTATVQQLHLAGTVSPRGSRENVGGIAGSNAGVITDCSFAGQVSGSGYVGAIAGTNTVSGVIENCKSEGNIHGIHFAGGIAGSNFGVLRSCENLASVNITPQENSVDISDVTLESLTGTESAGTVTDVGGIAGSSSGTIRGCVNRGRIGYRHMGYNIGGIVGSQTGYLADCENYGTVSGRKDVGGIAGQLEPVMALDFETDTLQLLVEQLTILSNLTERAQRNTESNLSQVRTLLLSMENYAARAQDAIDVLTSGSDDPDAYLAALQTLGSCLTGMETALRGLGQTLEDTGTDLENDMQAISNQMDVISGLVENGEDNLGGSLRDTSDADTAEDLTGKLENAVNRADILGDLNVGGIVGVMGLENDLDPEADVNITGQVSLNSAGSVRSVVLSCANQGTVTAGKQNAGGIVGWQSMGLVKQCSNTGTLEGGSYTGGIAGRSLGYIRRCYAKCTVLAEDNVGGIAGSGTVVTDCRSMVMLTGTEAVGAVLGSAEDNHTDEARPILGNFYACVDSDPGGIDGISYDTQAQRLEPEAFAALEALPELFDTVDITFLFEDGTAQVVSLPLGSGLTRDTIPPIPEKDGYEGRWDGLSVDGIDKVLFDMTFRAVYAGRERTIAGELTVGDKPQVLVQGDFPPDTVVNMQALEEAPQLSETLLAAWELVLSEQGTITSARYLVDESWDREALAVHVRGSDGSWKRVECTVSGSYLVFPLEAGETAFTVHEMPSAPMYWLWVSLAAVLIAGGTVTVLLIRKRKK